jgi:hypothetical protein
VAKVVPVQLDDNTVLYIEAQDDTETVGMAPIASLEDTGEQRRSGSKGISNLPASLRPSPVQSMQMVQNTIRTYAVYSLNAFKNLGNVHVDEVTLEFGVNLSADAGIPYIASGKAQSNLKITVKCSYNNKSDQDDKEQSTTTTSFPNLENPGSNGVLS